MGSVGVLDNGQQVAALGAELGFTPVDDTENADVCIADVLNILSVLVVGNNEGVGQRILGSEGVDRGCGRIVTDVQCGQGEDCTCHDDAGAGSDGLYNDIFAQRVLAFGCA